MKSLPDLSLLYALLCSGRVTSMCSLLHVVHLPSWCHVGRSSGAPRRRGPSYDAGTGGTTLTCRAGTSPADTPPCGTTHVDASARARHLYTAAHFTLTSITRVPPIAGPDPMGSGTAADTSVQRRPPQSKIQPPALARPILPNTQCRGTFPLTATLGASPGGDYR